MIELNAVSVVRVYNIVTDIIIIRIGKRDTFISIIRCIIVKDIVKVGPPMEGNPQMVMRTSIV